MPPPALRGVQELIGVGPVVTIEQTVAVHALPELAETGEHEETGVKAELLEPHVVVV